jgi:Ca2+-binding EF-hand superfamily protein
MVARLWSLSTPVALAVAAGILANAPPAAAQSAGNARMEQAVRQIFARFDVDGDGNITDAEFMQVGQRDFAALDANSDSIISKSEFLDPKPRGAEQLDSKKLARAKQIWGRQFAFLDTDKNSKLTATEHEAAGKDSFDRMDSNKDGEVTLAEMAAVAGQKQQQ